MRELHLMSYKDAEEYFRKFDLVLLPVGSIEQHGPANPLGTDMLIAESLAKEASKRAGVVTLPVIPVGVSFHHMHFPGTLTVSEHALEEYLMDVMNSLVKWGVKKVLIINGHGGNLTALHIVARRSLEELGVRVYIYQWWSSSLEALERLFDTEERGHAAAAETSLNMYLHPEAVRKGRLLDQGVTDASIMSKLIGFDYTAERSSSGVFGKQSTASADRGRALFEMLVEDLIEVIEILRKG
ncbi:MAG: creatininase family protein [Candidatus Korarchaeum sp.]|nr:creatininase family protein [Candidatus Korarchaeum sp.]MDW8036110.1 creatininase family protein [Candidatus Korarchaeum sp.]